MAGTVAFGFSATPAGTGCGDGTPDPAGIFTTTLTNGLPAVDQAVNVPASTTIGSPVRLWTSANHGVSKTAAAVDIATVTVDPARADSSTQTLKVRPVYTRTGATTTVNGAAFEYRNRDHPPMTLAGTLEDGTGVLYLTAIEAANANTDDILARVKAWG